MESIVVLADFTPESRSALEYGYALAVEKSLPIVLIHTYDVPILYTPDAFSGTFLPIEGAQNIAAENLKRLAAEYATRFPQVPTTTHIALTGPDIILDREDIATAGSLVIIGINKENMNDWWEDHQDLDILRDSHHNVLAVQLGFAYRPVKTITLALRADQAPESFPLAQLQSVLSLTGATLQVVTVNAQAPLSAALQESLAPLQAAYHEITGSDDIDTTLARFVLENPTDWLAVVPGEYGFWGSLFHKSHTLALAEQSTIPVLALHLEYKRK